MRTDEIREITTITNYDNNNSHLSLLSIDNKIINIKLIQ